MYEFEKINVEDFVVYNDRTAAIIGNHVTDKAWPEPTGAGGEGFDTSNPATYAVMERQDLTVQGGASPDRQVDMRVASLAAEAVVDKANGQPTVGTRGAADSLAFNPPGTNDPAWNPSR